MKLSVSAYRAHASAHKKILDTAYQLNYGSTQASSTSQQHYKVEPLSADDAVPPGGPGPQPGAQLGPTTASYLGADNSGSDTPVTSPRSPLNTSRDEDDDSSNAASSDCKSPKGSDSFSGAQEDKGSLQSVAEATAKAASQSWKNIRAVMAYYHTLRKIKRTKSNQRWMKLRTTVQISSAIQKKPPLKREDSFLKRFSTRQIPETQETVEDTGSEGNGAHQSAPRRRRRPAKLPKTVVNPDENFYFYWLLALTVCVLYNLWALIVRQSFPELQALCSGFWVMCDAVSDVVFLLDVGVQLRTGYLEQGLMVYDSKKLAGHYLHSRAFLLDLGALCPLDLLQVRFGPQPMLRFPRFLKVYRAVNYYYMVESRTVWPNLWRVVNLIHILLILAHWFGCFYFLLSEAEGFQGDWVYPYRPGDYATLTRKYLGSLYWSTLTLTTIGDLPTPETNAEKAVTVDGPKSIPRRGLKSRLLQFDTNGGYVFTIVSYLIGVFIFATIVGQVGNVITNRNANRLEFERLLDGAKTYMRHHKVPSGMKKRVLRWYDYSWSRGRIQGGGDINTALGLLPDKLKTELALHVNLSVLKKVTIFQECQPEFLHDLVLKMKAYIFTPGDSICRKGEVAREMFIIADGILEVLSEAGRVLTTMKAGDFFGEIGILNLDGLNKRTADVRSVGYSELFSLSREDVLAAMKDYPEAQEILQALGRKRLMEVRNSARQFSASKSKHHRHHNTANTPGPPAAPPPASPDHLARSLVGKLKSSSLGLRNALRKSRTQHRRRSDESLELQPLHAGAPPHRAHHPLRRMPRVRSDDTEGEERDEPHVSPLGAGLPLLSRLRLLKEKQDFEDRSTTSGAALLPPGTATLGPEGLSEAHHSEPEVIGAGLPLLQRLLLLKAKEDRERPSGAPVTAVGPSAGPEKSRSPSPVVSPLLKTMPGKVSFRDRIFAVRGSSSTPASAPPAAPAPPLASPPGASTPDVVRDTRDCASTSEGPEPLSVDSDPWSKLKQASIGGATDTTTTDCTSASVKSTKRTKPSVLELNQKQYESVDDLSPEYCGLPFVKKLKILNERQKLFELESAMKTRSVSLDIPENSFYDDSILTRSHSEASAMHKNSKLNVEAPLGPPTSPESNETPERRNLKSILKKLSEDARPKPKNVKKDDTRSSASDLRQLLRAPTVEGYAARHSKLAKSVTFDRDTLPSPPGGPPGGVPLMPQALGAPMLPGLTRGSGSEPPPHEELLEGPSQVEGVPEPPCSELTTVEEEAPNKDDKERGIVPTTGGNQVKFIKAPMDEHEYFGTALIAIKQVISAHLQEMQHKFQTRFDHLEAEVRSRDVVIERLRHHIQDLERSLDDEYTVTPMDEHEYFGTALIAIKQVISAHLQEMQHKFQTRFDHLEAEVRSRDVVIERLRHHIQDLERTLDDEYTVSGSDSASTVLLRPSWESLTATESIELEDLPLVLRPERAWSPSQDSVTLELGGPSDTDDSGSEAEHPPPHSRTAPHNANWELEMLAAEMGRRGRSASVDHSARAAPQPHRRPRLCRGFSADAGPQ